jgi:mannose-6-phosphate isomerase-like protein (cupin superfamily)
LRQLDRRPRRAKHANSPCRSSTPVPLAAQGVCAARELKYRRYHPMLEPSTDRRWKMVDFAQLAGVDCPCGTSRRAFGDVADFPATVHQTEISSDAVVHYHRRLTEVYYILECAPDAAMQLDDERVSVAVGMCILIPPLVRHRAIGRMKVLVIVFPKFDPADEWLD